MTLIILDDINRLSTGVKGTVTRIEMSRIEMSKGRENPRAFNPVSARDTSIYQITSAKNK